MTWFAASGDSGGADCYDGIRSSPGGLSVDLPAGCRKSPAWAARN